jgi:hypothetical protein
LEPIGIGPSGSVSRAKVFGVAGFERQFAIKRFHPELTATAAMAAMLSAAARAYGSLEHPRIARMSEFGVAQGATFTAVEFVQGLDALRLIGEARLAGATLAAGGALALVSQAARAVGYAHGRGLTHLGLAPTNVIVTAEGDIKITDFGILSATLPSRPIDVARLTQRIPYLAPEQLANEATSAATDVFALGVLAYELVTGTRTFKGETPQQVASAIMAGPPAEPPLPRPIVRVLQRCLARSPFERFPDARALADALDAALRVAPVPGTRKDIGAQVKETLDRLAALNDGQMSGMVALHLGTGPIRRVAEDEVRAATPVLGREPEQVRDPSEALTYEIARPDLAAGDRALGASFGAAGSTVPDLPKLPITTMPGLPPPPIPVPPGVAPPPIPPTPAPGASTLLGIGKPPAIPAIRPRPGSASGIPAKPPAVPPLRRSDAPIAIESPAVAAQRDATVDSAIHTLDPSDVLALDDVADAEDDDASRAPTSQPFGDDFQDAPTHAINETRTGRPSAPQAAVEPPPRSSEPAEPRRPSAPRDGGLFDPIPASDSAAASVPALAQPRGPTSAASTGSGPASAASTGSGPASTGSSPTSAGSSPTSAGSSPASTASAGSGPTSAGSGPTSAGSGPTSTASAGSGPTSAGSSPASTASAGSGTASSGPTSAGSGPTSAGSASAGSGPTSTASAGSGPTSAGSRPTGAGSGPTSAPASSASGPISTSGASPASATAPGASGPIPSATAPSASGPTPSATAPGASGPIPSASGAMARVSGPIAVAPGDVPAVTDVEVPAGDASERFGRTMIGVAAPIVRPRAPTPSPPLAAGPNAQPQSAWQRPLGDTQPEDVPPVPTGSIATIPVADAPPHPAPIASIAPGPAVPPPGWITAPPPHAPPPITPLASTPSRRGAWIVIGMLGAAGLGVAAWQIYERSKSAAPVASAPADAHRADATQLTAAIPDAAETPAPDARPADAGPADAGKPVDAGKPADAGKPDAPADAGKPDAVPADAARAADAGAPDAATAVATNPPPVSTSAAGDLTIASTPAGARVFLDGTDTGATPVKLPGTADRHNIALVLPGHELYVAQVDGHGSFQIPLKEVTPTNGPAGIKVLRCKKDRYYVFLDGKPTGQTCPTERIGCEVGPHTIEVYDVVTETRRKWDITVKDTRLSFRVRVE